MALDKSPKLWYNGLRAMVTGVIGPSIYRASIHEGELTPFQRLALAIVCRAIKDMGNSSTRQAAQDYLRSDEVLFYLAVAGRRDQVTFLNKLQEFLSDHGIPFNA